MRTQRAASRSGSNSPHCPQRDRIEVFPRRHPCRPVLKEQDEQDHQQAGRADPRAAQAPRAPAQGPQGRRRGGPAPAAGDGGEYPLSFAQQRLWLLDRLEPGSAATTCPAALRLARPLDAAAVERALAEIVRRHEALRTRFPAATASRCRWSSRRHLPLPLSTIWPLCPDGAGARGAGPLAGGEADAPFDLAAGPPFRARCVRLGADDHVLLIAMHHIVSDGWSLGVFWRETFGAVRRLPRRAGLAAAAAAACSTATMPSGSASGWPATPLERHAGVVARALAGAPALLELPADRPRPAVASAARRAVRSRVPADVVGPLRALAGQQGATLFMVLLAAYQLLLGPLGRPGRRGGGHPRRRAHARETEPLIGFFVNTLALRARPVRRPHLRRAAGARARAPRWARSRTRRCPSRSWWRSWSPERSLAHVAASR